MGRPSVAAERRVQIYDAALRCARIHGVQGTTLERIAKEAGMSRGHVRHFAGNRDELMVEAARHFYGYHRNQHPWRESDERRFDTIDAALDYLFGSEITMPGDDNAIVYQFIDAARVDPALAQVIAEAYAELQSEIERALDHEVPRADADARARAAYGILCLSLGNVFMADVDLSLARSGISRISAQTIVDDYRLAARATGTA